MNIEIETVDQLVLKADKIVLTPEAEDTLLKLLKIQDQIEGAIKEAESRIEAAGLKLNPAFKSVIGDNIKVSYRQYGAKYKIDEVELAQLPNNLYKVSKRYDAIAEEVDKWVDEHKGLPIGIIEVDRPKTLHFGLKNKTENE